MMPMAISGRPAANATVIEMRESTSTTHGRRVTYRGPGYEMNRLLLGSLP